MALNQATFSCFLLVSTVSAEVSLECLANNKNCQQSFDGCNGCSCTDAQFPICTQLACEPDELDTPTCNQCANNLIYDDEGCNDPCWRSKTCSNRAGAEICFAACIPECKCPDNAPYWDEDTISCLTDEECDQLDTGDDNPTDEPVETEEPVSSSCPDLCTNYNDGCNTCICSEGDGIGFCTLASCDVFDEPVCNSCLNNLVYKRNGNKCWKQRTCDNKRGGLSIDCRLDRQSQCQCPLNKPYWDEESRTCLSRRECRENGY